MQNVTLNFKSFNAEMQCMENAKRILTCILNETQIKFSLNFGSNASFNKNDCRSRRTRVGLFVGKLLRMWFEKWEINGGLGEWKLFNHAGTNSPFPPPEVEERSICQCRWKVLQILITYNHFSSFYLIAYFMLINNSPTYSALWLESAVVCGNWL